MHNDATKAMDEGRQMVALYVDQGGERYTGNCEVVEQVSVGTSPFGSTRIEPAGLRIIDHYSPVGAFGHVTTGGSVRIERGGPDGDQVVDADLVSVACQRESDALILLRAGFTVKMA